MIEPEIDTAILRTQKAIIQFSKKRDVLLKLLEKESKKITKKQGGYVWRPPLSEKSLFEELEEMFRRLTEFDIERSFKLICDFQSEYRQIYIRNVHADVMKREMVRFLSNSADDVLAYDKQLGELYEEISNLYKHLNDFSPVRTECMDALEQQMNAIITLKCQFRKNIARLGKVIEYFKVATECPPHL